MSAWHGLARESARYFAASALALGVDVGLLSLLTWGVGANYLVAAPVAFAVGLAAIYVLSIRWVFRQRRLKDARAEFTLFALLGLAGLGLNQLVLYVAVGMFALPLLVAKAISAGLVFCFNFGSRKLMLFTHYR